MGVGGQERRKKKTQNVPVHELHGVKKNQATGRAETAAWAQGKEPCQAHREELGKQDSGTCSEIQDSTCREQPEVVGGEANPHGGGPSTAKRRDFVEGPQQQLKSAQILQGHRAPVCKKSIQG